jgi:hypothetical protein
MKKIFFALGLFLTLISGTSQNLNLDSLRKNFKGYKVPTNVKSLGSTFWKRNSPVMIDLVIQTFQKPLAFNEIGNQQHFISKKLNRIYTRNRMSNEYNENDVRNKKKKKRN